MARRRRESEPQDGLLYLTSLLPWWLCLLVGLVSHFLLSHVAAKPLPMPEPNVSPTAMVWPGLWHGLAGAGQYIVPIVCLAAAVVSWSRSRKR